MTKLTAVQFLGPVERWPEDAIYIGMPGKAARAFGLADEIVGPFGKPWACLDDPRGWQVAYREYLWLRLQKDASFEASVKALAGKTLVCWCKAKGANTPCHGEILIKAIEYLNGLPE